MMKKILIPTDLSELGDFAYSTALILAKKTNATIEAISIIPGPQGAFYSQHGELLNDEGNDYSEWHKRLQMNEQKMATWKLNKPAIAYSSCFIGNVDQGIIDYAESNSVDLIVMGTEGLFTKSNLWSKGSHTEYITNHTAVPVLSLKCDRSDLDLREMVFVGDFLVNEKVDLSIVKSIQKVFESKLLLLKIKLPTAKRNEAQIRADMQAFATTNDLENYEMNIFEDQNVEAGIGKFSASRAVDIILLGTHQGKGFSRLFRNSISDDVVNHLYHPILTFPI